MKIKKIISSVFATTFLFNTVFATSIISIKDMPTGWSKDAVFNAVENEILIPDEGYIRATDLLTRAEMALGINNIFGTIDKADLSEYTDVPQTKWYYEEMAKAVDMGLFSGYGNGLLKPEKNITREEMFAAIYNALSLDKGEATALEKFNDRTSISDWAKDIVARMAQDNYVAGNLLGNVKPLDPITREEFAQIMKNIFAIYYSDAGTYTAIPQGNIVINSPEVILKDAEITGDLIITEGVGNGSVTLDNVIVKGRVFARSGQNIRLVNNSKVEGKLVISNPKASTNIYAEKSEIKNVELKTNANLEGDYQEVIANGATELQVKANVKEIVVDKTSQIKVSKSKVEKVIVNETGNDTKISGSGKVTEVNANANNVQVSTDGTKVTAGINTVGVKAGEKDVLPGTSVVVKSSSGGGGGGGGGGGSGGGSSGVCSHKWQTKTAATCTTAEVEMCSKCKQTREGDAAIGHNWEDTTPATCTNAEVETCSRCKETQEVGSPLGHKWVDTTPATCTSAEVETCEVCKETRDGDPALGHKWVETTPGTCITGKIETCEVCKETQIGETSDHKWVETTPATCTTGNIEMCETCGDTKIGEALGHSYDENEVCTVCGNSKKGDCDHSWVTIAPETCTTYEVQQCEICKELRQGKDALDHQWKTLIAETCTTNEIEQCSSCSITRYGESAYGHDWQTKSEATCLEPEQEICNNCKDIRDGDAALGHDVTTVNPTCTEDGAETCSRCDYEKVLDKLGHDMVETLPTCTEDGYLTCSRFGCGYTEEGEEKLGHDMVETLPTCTEDGYFACSREGCDYTEEGTAALGHDMQITTEATCTTKGLKECIRENCDESEEIEALGHELKISGSDCTEDGYIKCINKGCDYKENKTNHEVKGVEATCTLAGLEICLNEGCSYYKVIDAKGHTWGEWIEATCTDAKYRVCSANGCNIKEVEGVALGHNYEDGVCTRCNSDTAVVCSHEWKEITAPTCTTVGIDECERCGATKDGRGALEHAWVEKAQATCKNGAIEECSKCFETKEVGSPSDHNWITVDPTCTTTGYTYCENCSDIKDMRLALGHTLNENNVCIVCGKAVCSHEIWETVMEATCTTAEIERCSVCDSEREGDPATGHTYQLVIGATCTTSRIEECSKCDFMRKVGEPLGHNWVTTSPAKCGVAAIQTCSNCGKTQSSGEVENHNFVVTEPTCTTDGYSTCSICGIKEQVTSALGHEFGDEQAATCVKGSYKECRVCHYEEILSDPIAHDLQVVGTNCTEEGFRKCADCEYIENELTHNIHVVGNDCTEEGYSICTTAGCTYEEHTLEHIMKIVGNDCTVVGYKVCESENCTYEEHEVEHNITTIDATCDVDGSKTCTRENCNHIEVLTMLGHVWGEAVEPTCIEDGYTPCTRDNCDGKTDIVTKLGHEITSITIPVTCTTDGEKKCIRCDETEVITKLGHKLEVVGTDCTEVGYSICTNDDCTYEEHKDAHNLEVVGTDCTAVGYKVCVNENCIHEEHEAEHDIETIAATCEEDGLDTCTRENCEYTNVLTQLGHSWGEAVAPTCTEDGYTPCTRENCNETINIVAKLGHDISNIIVAATCTEDGVRQCIRCNETEVISKLGHELEIIGTDCTEDDFIQCVRDGCDYTECEAAHRYKIIEETCIEKGYEVCLNEGCKVVNEIPALGHAWVYDDEEEYPTCTEGRYRVCNTCGISELLEMAIGHNFVNGQCTNVGCTETISGKVCDHNWEDKDKATCTTPATQYCSICGTVEDVGAAKGHTWGTPVKATCTTIGYTQCTVKNCGERTDIILALGHNFAEGTVVEATCKGMGYTKCKNCNEISNMVPTVEHSFGDDGKCKWCKVAQSAICSHGDYEVLSLADCINAEQRQCNICDLEYEYGTALGHDNKVEKIATCTVIGVEECSRCGLIQEVGLDDHAWITTVPATCSTSARQTCNKCGATRIDPETANPSHTWNEEYTVDETCTSYGRHTCGVCGVTEVDLDREPLGHDYTVEVEAPGCESTGTAQCIRCTATTIVPATGHSFDTYESEYDKPTCVDVGWLSCSNEGCTEGQEVPALGHTRGETVSEGTCNKRPKYLCSVCDQIYPGEASDGHDLYKAEDASCTSPAIWKCNNCTYSANLDDVLIPHNSDIYVPANCKNVEQYKCSMCNQIQSEGKSFGDHIWEISEEATCTTDGEEECTVDGCGQTRKIDATGHQFANNICEVCDQPEIYTITFDATTNGGILEGDAIIEKTNNGISFEDDDIELPTAFKEGAIFDGWYTEDGGLIDAETVLSGTTADITVYAQFSQEVSE